MPKWLTFAGIVAMAILIMSFFLEGPEQTAQVPVREGEYRTGDRLAAVFHGEQTEFREIDWPDLIPPDWIPEQLLNSLNVDELEDNDPRALEALQTIREQWSKAPVVEEMDGQKIKIPGFLVPLEGDGKVIREFLLVPYFGACVHVPPPPSNQLIHVLPEQPIPGEWTMRPIWVTGELSVTRIDSGLGRAGYQLRAFRVEIFQVFQAKPSAAECPK